MSESPDHFARFGLPRRYSIDRKALEAAYERLTLAHHPDFYATAPAAQRAQAERTAAEVNAGYRVLSDDFERAGYLLGLVAGGRKLDPNSLAPEFLSEMFDLQEHAEALLAENDLARLKDMRRTIAAEREAVRMHLDSLFEAIGGDPATDDLQSIQSDLNCERYLQRLLARLDGQRDD